MYYKITLHFANKLPLQYYDTYFLSCFITDRLCYELMSEVFFFQPLQIDTIDRSVNRKIVFSVELIPRVLSVSRPNELKLKNYFNQPQAFDTSSPL